MSRSHYRPGRLPSAAPYPLGAPDGTGGENEPALRQEDLQASTTEGLQELPGGRREAWSQPESWQPQSPALGYSCAVCQGVSGWLTVEGAQAVGLELVAGLSGNKARMGPGAADS